MATKRTPKRKQSRHDDRKKNVTGRLRVAAKSQGGRVYDLDESVNVDSGRTNGRAVDSVDNGQVLAPIEQAIQNWKSRQANVPWWWLSFSYGIKGKVNGPEKFRHAGVVIVQGWNFVDAINQANKLKVSPLKAAVYGEELSDLWMPKEGEQEQWVNRLLEGKEVERVFGEVEKVTEASLYSAKKDEVKFS